LTYHIHRSERPDEVVFVLSGVMDLAHATHLRDFLATEASVPVTLDLRDVTRVDRAAVSFLTDAEAAGIRLINCPEYVRSWIAGERKARQQRTHQPHEPEPRS